MISNLKVGDTIYQYQERTWAYSPWFEEYKIIGETKAQWKIGDESGSYVFNIFKSNLKIVNGSAFLSRELPDNFLQSIEDYKETNKIKYAFYKIDKDLKDLGDKEVIEKYSWILEKEI